MFLLQRLRSAKIFQAISTIAVLSVQWIAGAAEGDVFESVSAGTSVTFSASADGSPTPTFQWVKDGAVIVGATDVTLIIPNPTTDSAGVYNAIATNSEGWALSNDLILTVTTTTTAVAPSFTLQPFPSATAPTGSSITLSAAAAGSPTPTYQWRKNGVSIAAATDSMLSFASLTTSDSATYSVVASNSAGTATSNDSVLMVVASTALDIAPTITTQPISQTVKRRSPVSLTVAASGSPAPTFQWQRNGTDIAGATDATYTISSVSPSNGGTYVAVATNTAGSATSQAATITVTR